MKTKKFRVPITITTVASTVIGEVECDSAEEFMIEAEKLWEAKGWESPATNCHNEFDLGDDWDISEFTESDLKYYKIEK